MTWLSDHLLELDSSDERSFSHEIAKWCFFVKDAGYDSTNVVGTFEEWLHEHSHAEPLSARRLALAELEIKKFYDIPTKAPRLVPADEPCQPSPPPEKTLQQFPSMSEASEVQPVDGFGQIHPDRLKLSRYGDTKHEEGEVIDVDDWQCPVVAISSDEDVDPQTKNTMSFLTGANRMVFGEDEAIMTTDLQGKKKKTKKAKKSKAQAMQSGPTSIQTQEKNKASCGRCGVPGHYHMQCPTNLDPSFDKSPPNEYKCNFCNRYGDHYATVCKRNMNPTSLTQQRKRFAERGRQFHPSRGRSSSPLRGPNDKRHIGRERSPYRVPRDRHRYDRESSPYRESETRHHVDRDRSRERRRSRERCRRRRSRSKSRSPSPPRQALPRRDNPRAFKEYRLKHPFRRPSFQKLEPSSPPQLGAPNYGDAFEHMPDAPYRPLGSRPTEVKIRGRGSSLYYDDNVKGAMPASVYGNEDLMSRKTHQPQTPAPHQDDYVYRPTLYQGSFITELTDLIASTTVSPPARAPMKSRLPEVFKNDLRQSSGSWVIEPTMNTTLVKPELVPHIVREPSPPVELGVTEKRLDGRHGTRYHPAILELFKNRKNVWVNKIDKAMRSQASSFFWDADPKDLEEELDVSADTNAESASDTVMTEAEPVATAIDEANSEATPVALLTDGPRRVDSTPAIDVVMENHTEMQILYRDEDGAQTHHPCGDGRVGFKPPVDAAMEDAEPLGFSAAVDVSAIVDEVIAEVAAKTTSGLVEKESPSIVATARSETLSLPNTVNLTSAESADIVRKVKPGHGATVHDHENCTPMEGAEEIGDNSKSETAIKDVIHVEADLEPVEVTISQPEDQVDVTVFEGSKAQ
ncbi:hypothetical protein GE21DRAFT_6212 [Neurospora crassa]|uniref:CCHC-type domain-containing protein n=1 Tax=Neurospora crassa (strain ATCC 24698 / 74-OR23-1A / CBS 708.71 / DSM 1257 / FGSC 987) TaxID=367110 RepID=Q7SAQ0_NEUCR|nr:hypothetical protein NCU07990 [Neurospora crassa OR74A]EAA33424.1 hypothetical protein NCU07990 [Neurospora crassa OR74A]KHE84448.1 hypothetical protein GE21DRAFT_6212 [Neurospora crassa]|eukprot:XP_962660.1 hypothetical protein NCU07990 [Neurospora crassa OR74A]